MAFCAWTNSSKPHLHSENMIDCPSCRGTPNRVDSQAVKTDSQSVETDSKVPDIQTDEENAVEAEFEVVE
jgi:hypothetical protein